MINREFVPYQQAFELKELGFNFWKDGNRIVAKNIINVSFK
jgi:hypothetical protein